jgi:hypothetical protein
MCPILANSASRELVFVSVVVLCPWPVVAAACQSPPPDSGRQWAVEATFATGSPGGWIQVRENQVRGTRLNFRQDLGVGSLQTVALDAELHPGRRTEWNILIESYSLRGRAVLSRDVNFNGATLAANSRLLTRTDFPSFLQGTVTVRRRLASLANGGMLRWDAGLTFVALEFRLSGTLAAASIGSETKEDFVSQELPIPVAGASLEQPVAGPLTLRAAIDGGYLPSISSLRREGGEVMLQQSHFAASLAMLYRVHMRWNVRLGYEFTGFAQHERSREDGNDIHVDSSALLLGLGCLF